MVSCMLQRELGATEEIEKLSLHTRFKNILKLMNKTIDKQRTFSRPQNLIAKLRLMSYLSAGLVSNPLLKP